MKLFMMLYYYSDVTFSVKYSQPPCSPDPLSPLWLVVFVTFDI